MSTKLLLVPLTEEQARFVERLLATHVEQSRRDLLHLSLSKLMDITEAQVATQRALLAAPAEAEAARERKAKLVGQLELAIQANGGSDYDEAACECDATTTPGPCRYCAIRDALNESLRYLVLHAR